MLCQGQDAERKRKAAQVDAPASVAAWAPRLRYLDVIGSEAGLVHDAHGVHADGDRRATTIHKVQGQTLTRLILDLAGGAFAPGQNYVAVNRCRSMDGLRLRCKIDVAGVRCDSAVGEFVDAIQQTLANRVLER